MNKSIITRSGLVFALLISVFLFSFASKKDLAERTIHLAGLVVNAQTLASIDAAKIYDDEGNLLGATDKNGYYHIEINYKKEGELYFKLKIIKQGFRAFTHNEHWGNLDDPKNIMYFGLCGSHDHAKSFSSFANNSSNENNLDYDNVLSHFGKVRAEKAFNDKLASAKAGNENVLILIDGQFYIVDKSGWIKVNSDQDLISLDDKQIIKAAQLNSTIKRKDIKWMTPLDGKEAKFAIHTRSPQDHI